MGRTNTQFLCLYRAIAVLKGDGAHETSCMWRSCAALAIIVTAAEFIKHFWSTPGMPSTVLVDVIRTDDPFPDISPVFYGRQN